MKRMAILPRPASPRAVLADLRATWAGDRRHKLLFGALAMGITSLWVTLFIIESWWGVMPEGQQITYVQSFAADRSDAEIMKQNVADQKVRDAALARKRAAFRKVDDAMTKYGL